MKQVLFCAAAAICFYSCDGAGTNETKNDSAITYPNTPITDQPTPGSDTSTTNNGRNMNTGDTSNRSGDTSGRGNNGGRNQQ